MDSVVRISGIPVVETGIKSVENVYGRFKVSFVLNLHLIFENDLFLLILKI